MNSGSVVNIGTVTLLSNLPADNKKEIITDTTEDQDKTVVTDESKEDKTIARTETRKKDFKRKVSIAMRRRGGYDTVESEIVPASGSPLLEPQPDTASSATTTGTIAGSVFDSVTKQAIQDASVTIAGKPSVNTDEQGVFAVGDILPDTCQVTIFKEGYINQFYQGDLGAGETMDMLIYLTPACMDTDETGETETISEYGDGEFRSGQSTNSRSYGPDPGPLNASPAVKNGRDSRWSGDID